MTHPSPLLGFNSNVKHRGRAFHIQTEDSGVKHPHVITHLFADGGRILKSLKTSYAEKLDSESLAEHVRELMKRQHKAMFLALRDGQFDGAIDAGEHAGHKHGHGHKHGGHGTKAQRRRAAPEPFLSPDSDVPLDLAALERAALAAEAGADDEALQQAHSGAYCAARPASIFGESSPADMDARIREQSLDEVILAFVEGDLAGARSGS